MLSYAGQYKKNSWIIYLEYYNYYMKKDLNCIKLDYINYDAYV